MIGVNDPRSFTRIIVNLFIGPRRKERGKCVYDRQQASERQPARHGNHILFRNSILDKTIRMSSLETAQATISGQIGSEYDEIFTSLGNIGECFAVCFHDVL